MHMCHDSFIYDITLNPPRICVFVGFGVYINNGGVDTSVCVYERERERKRERERERENENAKERERWKERERVRM